MQCDDDPLGVLRERVKWRSRRGLLELDLLLTRFLARELGKLGEAELVTLLELLVTDDIVLWGWVSGREDCPVEAWHDWISAIRHP